MGQGSVDSVAHPGWGGRIENRPFNHLPRNSRKNLKLWERGTVLGTGLDNEGVLQPRRQARFSTGGDESGPHYA